MSRLDTLPRFRLYDRIAVYRKADDFAQGAIYISFVKIVAGKHDACTFFQRQRLGRKTILLQGFDKRPRALRGHMKYMRLAFHPPERFVIDRIRFGVVRMQPRRFCLGIQIQAAFEGLVLLVLDFIAPHGI